MTSPSIRSLTPLAMLGAALLVPHLAACGDKDDPAGADSGAVDDTGGSALEFYDPDARGPYSVGTQALSLTGSTGVELAVQVWYPTAETEGDLHAYGGFVAGGALDAPEPQCDRARPVLLFSHGNGGVNFQSPYLTEYLASHGWVVVAPDHTYNTLFDYDDARVGELMIRRPQDIKDAFDWAASSASPVADCVDEADGYAVAGHSFGGYTSLAVAGAPLDVAASAEVCADTNLWLCPMLAAWGEENPGETAADLADPRAWAAVPMAPAGFEVVTGGLPEISVPTLVWGGSRDTLTSMEVEVGPIYEGLAVSPRALGELEDAGHYTFSNACDWVTTYDDCSDPYLPGEVAHPIIATVTTAFLDRARGAPGRDAWLPTSAPELTYTAE